MAEEIFWRRHGPAHPPSCRPFGDQLIYLWRPDYGESRHHAPTSDNTHYVSGKTAYCSKENLRNGNYAHIQAARGGGGRSLAFNILVSFASAQCDMLWGFPFRAHLNVIVSQLPQSVLLSVSGGRMPLLVRRGESANS
jgi:hypothetical protein